MAVPFVALAKNGGANEIWTRVSEGQGNTSTIIVYFDILLHVKQTKSIKED